MLTVFEVGILGSRQKFFAPPPLSSVSGYGPESVTVYDLVQYMKRKTNMLMQSSSIIFSDAEKIS